MIGHTTKFWPMKSKRKPMENFLEEFLLPWKKCNGRSSVLLSHFESSHMRRCCVELLLYHHCTDMAERLTKILTQSLDIVEELSKLWNHPPSDLCCAKWLNVVIPNSLRAGTDSEGHQAEPEWDGVSGKTSKRGWLTLAHQLFRENGAHIYFGKTTNGDTLWTHFLESLLNWLNLEC